MQVEAVLRRAPERAKDGQTLGPILAGLRGLQQWLRRNHSKGIAGVELTFTALRAEDAAKQVLLRGRHRLYIVGWAVEP